MAAKPASTPAHLPPGQWHRCLEHAPSPMATVEGATHILRYANPAFCRLMDRPAEQLVGRTFREMLPEHDDCVTLLDRVYRSGKSESLTSHRRSEPPAVFWSYVMWPVIAGERPVGVVIQVTETPQPHEKTLAMNEALVLGSVRQHELTEAADSLNAQLQEEISERKQMEAALRASEERYRFLFDSIDEGFCVVELLFDENGTQADYRFLEMNPSFEHQSGIRGAMGQRMREIAPDQEEFWFETYANVARTGKPIRFENESKALNRWFDVYAFRLGDPESRKVAILFKNITERKRADEALRASEGALRTSREKISRHAGELAKNVTERTSELTATNRQLEAFVYSIAHDLRAPLRAMQGFSAMLVEEAGAALSDAGRDYADRISKSAQFMDAMLRDLLAFSKISQQRVELAPVNMEAVVESVLSRLQEDICEKSARAESAGPWPLVLAHEPTLMQVLFNLTSNALKFVVPDVPPLVRLRAEEQGEFIRVWVEDNGIGIAPDHQDQIFRLFTRLRGDKYQGTGIGLAIVQKGVERMGGRVGVESAAGQGSRFWLELRKA